MAKTYQGIYTPQNKEKYVGNVKNIQYRSSWEKKAMIHFDLNPSIIYWSSEEISINYVHPVDHKTHRYFPDFLVKMKTKSGEIKTCIIEVKPFSQTQDPSKKAKRKTKRLLEEMVTYQINMCKFVAAEKFCKEQGWDFLILTEKELFGSK